jgi:hypothetical protein
MLPIFGGAFGGLIYAGLTAASQPEAGWTGPPTSSGSNAPQRSSGVRKKILGALLILGGCSFLALASVHFYDTWNIAQREPTVVTAADLCRKDYTATAPDWIAYTFSESKPANITVTRQRLGRGGEAEARCLVVRADKKWLIATVGPGFEGNNLVGRLLPLDSPASQSLIERVRKVAPNRAALLPFEFNALDGSASDQRQRYTAAGFIAVFGVLGLLLGLYFFRCGRRPVQSPPEPATTNWTYQAAPNG